MFLSFLLKLMSVLYILDGRDVVAIIYGQYCHCRLLSDHIASHVRLQRLGYAYAFFGLVVFQQGCQNAWQRKGRTVQCVTELSFPCLSIAIPAFQPICLICVEVAHGTYLKPSLLCFAVYLEVVTDGRGEALVSSTQTEDSVGQFQFHKQALHVFQHLPMALGRVAWGVDADYLYLREFV